MINFNEPVCTGKEIEYLQKAMANKKISGDGEFTRLSCKWIEERTGSKSVFMTTSCTHALEMSAILAEIKPGDEVIMPAYTFVSTANAFVLRGAKIVFVDIRPDTMNIDEMKIEKAITKRTKVIVPVHYAGVSCEMDMINRLANEYDLLVIEDAAQGVMSEYKGVSLGTLGDFGTYSFHETKNYTMGEGGALLIKDNKYSEIAEIIREKGTNRSRFFRGQVDKYTWVNMGSSYLPSELNVAYLWGQLEIADEINNKRLSLWNQYYDSLKELQTFGVDLPVIPDECKHNGHMFYLKCKNLNERTELIDYLKARNIQAVFHYIPLHTSPAGRKFGEFVGKDEYTTNESERLVRLPLYYGLEKSKADEVIEQVTDFYKKGAKSWL